MILPETGEVITPVDDPCQFNPAWRSIVAGYLFSCGIRDKSELDELAKHGGVTVTRKMTVTVTPDSTKRGKKGSGKAKPKTKTEVKKSIRHVHPFHEHPEYRAFAMDPWIAGQVSMYNDEINGKPLSDASVPLRLAERWYSEMDTEAAMKKRLEAMLLTEIGMDVITLDLTGMPSLQPAMEAYEKLYFNCRDENFNLSASMQLINRLAMPWGPLKAFLRKWEELDADGFCIQDGRPIAKDSDVWKAVAATMGYEALMYLWRWDRVAHGLEDRSLSHMIELSWKAAVARLMSDLYTGNIAHEDAARVLAAYSAQMKFISDDRKEGMSGDDSTMAVMAILKAAAPKMRILEAGGKGMITDNDIQSRIEAQQAIERQGIDDAGKQVANEVIDAQIADAIDG